MKFRTYLVAILRFCVWLVLACLAAAQIFAADWTDPQGDVSLPNADLISGSATIVGDMLDLRVRFAAPPFPGTATSVVSWCLDTDQNASTGGACGYGTYLGADAWVQVDGRMLSTCNFVIGAGRGTGNSTVEFDHYEMFWYDPATLTVRILVPLSVVSDTASPFNYAVEDSFGGSGGANGRAPTSPAFGSPGGFFTSDDGTAPPFEGPLWCTRETVSIDIQPSNPRNIVNLKAQGRVSVAVLTTESFDAATLFPSSALFGPTGTEAEPIDSSLTDVDRDGDLDLLLSYNVADTGIQCGQETATLKAYGEYRHGVQGTAPIRTIGCR